MSPFIPFEEMKSTIFQAMVKAGVPEDKAEICAQIHTESSADGVESHGLNRVPRFVEYVVRGLVDPLADPEIVSSRGAVERIDGHLGIGITNALFAADRAVELDLAGTMMSCGKCSHEISEPRDGSCGGCSQIFITYDPDLFGDYEEVLKKTEARVAAVSAAHPSNPARPVQWSGEGTAKRRAKSKERGISANEKVWEEVCRLAAK